jgi:O-antigen/teichoic acid export membrane protein
LKNNKLLNNTILYSIGEVIPRILSFILLPVLTSYLSTKEYGIVSYTNSVMIFVFVIASLSLNTFLLREFFLEKNIEKRRDLVGSIFYFILIFNVLLLILQWLIFPLLIDFLGIKISFYPFFLLAILNNFFDVLSIIPLVVYRVNDNAKSFVLVNVSRTIFQYLFVLLLLVKYDMGLIGSYYGKLLANIPFVVIYIIIIIKNSNFRFDFKILKNALKFSLPLLPGSISYILITLSDRVILERYISLNDLGIYSVAFTLALALNVVTQSIYKAIEPMVFKDFNSDNFSETNSKLYTIYLFLVILFGFGLSLFSKEVFLIATSPDFLNGYKIVPFILISVIISASNLYLDMLLIAAGKQKIVSYTTILSGIISVILNFALIPIFGFYGAIIASITAFTFTNIVCQFNVKLQKRYIAVQLLFLLIIIAIPPFYDEFISLNIDNLVWDIFLKSLIMIFFSMALINFFDIKLFKFLSRNQ